MNLRAFGKVTRIGCKYEPSFFIYIFRASPPWGLAQGQLHFCVLAAGSYLAIHLISLHSSFFDHRFMVLLTWKPDGQWTCACPLYYGLSEWCSCWSKKTLVHNHISGFGSSFITMLAGGGGRPLHSRMLIWRDRRYVLSTFVVWLHSSVCCFSPLSSSFSSFCVSAVHF